MADYKKMYIGLFREVTKAIDLLEKAQQATEDTFIETASDSDGTDPSALIRQISKNIEKGDS